MKNITKKMRGKQIFIPIVALVLLALFNLIVDPSFYKVTTVLEIQFCLAT